MSRAGVMSGPCTGTWQGSTRSWLVLLAVLVAFPLLAGQQGLGLASQIAIAIVACLSYHLLLGEGGLLSFGHAVHSGLGAYAAMHALNAVSAGRLPVPVSLLPLIGGLAGLASALLLGALATRRGGTAFAMITLGLGELVYALALMLPGLSGGEAGVTGNRVVAPAVWGISWASPLQMYGLIAAYTLASAWAMAAFTRTPLGLLLNASRDNPERLEFLGYSVWRVRLSAYMVSGFFAGVAGGLGALHFEIVTAEVLGAARSGALLMFTFLGGIGAFHGPVIGAVLMVLSTVWLSAWTQAWLLYLGLCFLLVVAWAPGGCAGLLAAAGRLCQRRGPGQLGVAALGLAATGLTGMAGLAVLIEMLYHSQLDATLGSQLRFLGLALDTASPACWFGATFVAVTGAGLLGLARRQLLSTGRPSGWPGSATAGARR